MKARLNGLVAVGAGIAIICWFLYGYLISW
jgi:uncharacterized protein with PQ loop repeat